MVLSIFQGISLFFKEMGNFNEIISEKNKKLRTLVFYSESAIYYQYYEGYIDYILKNSDLDICYLTSDIKDPVLNTTNNRIKPFYIKDTLAQTILNLDSKVLIMTMPDLNTYHIKRSNNNVNHVYLFHAIGSTHMQYKKGAFDHYDTILCIGPHQLKEIKANEEKYKLNKKVLVEAGYPRLEKIYNDNKNTPVKNTDKKTILIAPSWNETNILEICIKEFVSALKNSEFDVIIRPHPEFVKRKYKSVIEIQKQLKNIQNIKLELNLVSGESIHKSDILITDWSSISFEYAFGNERPVLFINTPKRIDNPDYEEIGIEPLELSIRNNIGRCIEVDEIKNIKSVLSEMIENKSVYKDKIIEYRNKYIYNWLNSSKIGGDIIIDLCKK